MNDVIVTERSRLVLSWGVFFALLTLVGSAVHTQASVVDHTRRLTLLETQAATAATKTDIERLENRIIRIETLLLSQQPAQGR
jgi:hypothetical protein